jgi:hypothetical protein
LGNPGQKRFVGVSKFCYKMAMKKMHIDSYRFGKMVIDGTDYSSDLIICAGTVESNWWRKQGHSLAAADLTSVIAAGPSILVVGCGASGLMQVPEETTQALQEQGIRVEAADTSEAVHRFNELVETGVDVAAAMHLTC